MGLVSIPYSKSYQAGFCGLWCNMLAYLAEKNINLLCYTARVDDRATIVIASEKRVFCFEHINLPKTTARVLSR
jgi:hypothetical protein